MKKSLIAMTSITYAMKAKNLLNSLKYYCEIQRTPKDLGTGCGYSIAVTAYHIRVSYHSKRGEKNKHPKHNKL